MAIDTNAPFRRVTGTVIRGVGAGAPSKALPLPGAVVEFTARIRSARTNELIIFDPVKGITDGDGVLLHATTSEVGVPLIVTDDPTVGATGWTWHVKITAESLERPVEFDMPVPSGTGDLDIAQVVPIAGDAGEIQFVWKDIVVSFVAAEVIRQLDDAGLLRRDAVFGPPEEGGDFRYSIKSLNSHTWVRFNDAGSIPPSSMEMLNEAGMPYFIPGDLPGFKLRTSSGNDTWITVGPDGLPLEETKWAIVNSVGVYFGADMPFPYPGKELLWFKLDPSTEAGFTAWIVRNDA